MAWSLDLRKRVVESYEHNEGKIKVLAKRFKISTSTIDRWLRQKRETGTLCRKLAPGRPRKIDEKGLKWLENVMVKNRDLTLDQLRQRYQNRFHIQICCSSMHYACERIKIKNKKNKNSNRRGQIDRSSTTQAI